MIMTTWHDSESLVDYLWYVAFLAWPTEGYFTQTLRHLILDIGEKVRPDLVSAVREVFVP